MSGLGMGYAPVTDDSSMADVAIMIDHLTGSRRGRRQVFAPGTQVGFGRHPDSDVRFDAHRDMDASSRHAELAPAGAGYVLRDVGSSNGTLVNGEQVTERPVAIEEPIVVEFGPGGPQVRVYIGSTDAAPPPAPMAGDEHAALSREIALMVAAAVAAVIAAAVIAWLALV